MKKYILPFILSSSVYAAGVEFSFFDSPVAQAEKFEKSFTPGQFIDSININGKLINLPQGNWRVVGAYSNESKIKMLGGGTDVQTTDGTLFLVSEENGKIVKTLYINSDLQKPRSGTWRSGDPDSCLPKNYWLHQQVNERSDKKRSCFAIKKINLDTSNSEERLLQFKKSYEAISGMKFPQDGIKIYRTSILQTLNNVRLNIVIIDANADREVSEEVNVVRGTWESSIKYW